MYTYLHCIYTHIPTCMQHTRTPLTLSHTTLHTHSSFSLIKSPILAPRDNPSNSDMCRATTRACVAKVHSYLCATWVSTIPSGIMMSVANIAFQTPLKSIISIPKCDNTYMYVVTYTITRTDTTAF